jgi:hypothetical protein
VQEVICQSAGDVPLEIRGVPTKLLRVDERASRFVLSSAADEGWNRDEVLQRNASRESTPSA